MEEPDITHVNTSQLIQETHYHYPDEGEKQLQFRKPYQLAKNQNRVQALTQVHKLLRKYPYPTPKHAWKRINTYLENKRNKNKKTTHP